jgi:pimeloyl-ACP methyl ester carboxylesterase
MPSFRTSDRVSIHYREAGAGPAVVLMPGGFVGTRCYEHQLDELSVDHHVIAMDLRGQGESEKTARGCWLGRAAMDVDELISEIGLEAVTLAGWGLSVSIALAYVDLFADHRLAGLCLISGGPRPVIDPGWPHGLLDLEIADQYRQSILANLQETIRANVGQLFPTSPPNFDEILDEALRAGPAEGQAAIIWSALTSDFRHLLRELAVPLLVVLGRDDPILSASIPAMYRTLVPAARIEVLEGAGHVPFIENAPRFNEVLAEFIASTGRVDSVVS